MAAAHEIAWASEKCPVGSSLKFTLVMHQGTSDTKFLTNLERWASKVQERFYGAVVIPFPEPHADGRLHAEVLVHVPQYNRLYLQGCQSLGFDRLDRLGDMLCRDWVRIAGAGKHSAVYRKLMSLGGIKYAIKGIKGPRPPRERRFLKLELALQALAALHRGEITEVHIRQCIDDGFFGERTWYRAVNGRGNGLPRRRGARGRFAAA
jgi:hypothetical protein